MARNITTNLRFPEGIYRDLQHAARRRGTSMACIVREAVAAWLGHDEGSAGIPLGSDPADRLIGSVTGGPDDESVNHDTYLYGWTPEAGKDGR